MRQLRTILGDGYRTFFLAAPLWALLAMALWLVWLLYPGTAVLALAPPPVEWHAHEMIWGYGGAAVAGFFLTAAPNWTGGPAAQRGFIALAAAVWLVGRAALWSSGALGPALVAAIDLAFVPVLATKLLVMLLRRPKPQNLMFLGILALFWWGDAMVHLDWLGAAFAARDGLATGLLALGALIAVLGGRVVPAFTRNALRRGGCEHGLPRSFAPLDALGIGAAVLLAAGWGAGFSPSWTAPLALLAGLAQAARLAFWHSGATLRDPLLWSLHLSFAMLALGYLALGLAGLGLGSQIGALHILGIGAVGGMTLAIMTRASLGHSGLPLTAPRQLVPAFLALAAAALLRWVSGVSGALPLTVLAGLLWLAAFALFLSALAPVLVTPRRDS